MSTSKPRGKNWTHLEDEALCQAWLHVSQDPIVGTNQKSENLYGTIFDKFIEICSENCVSAQPDLRAPSGIKGRWHFINKSVSKFAGCMTQINASQQSGASPEDNLKKALTPYVTKEKSPFMMMHCYRILESAPKWQQYNVLKVPAVKRSAESLSNDGSEETDGVEQSSTNEMDRPRGRDANKKQKNLGSETFELANAGKLLAVAAKAKVKDSIERTKVLKRIANHSIMSIDFSKLSNVAKKYYALEQHRILEETYQEVAYASQESSVESTDVMPVSVDVVEEYIDSLDEYNDNNHYDNYNESTEVQELEALSDLLDE
ncbi:uncharacterized protein LOC131688218 [Topomyia yanbarensis]|uniref:uncharacterized protein LOC131688218 n=1 Tax=Topomyia yanbarensis TaxID=2498891 RepID=UPI00273C9217|nr:uncharacterized protein LOC131688218 [Topomyia yanbarensis]